MKTLGIVTPLLLEQDIKKRRRHKEWNKTLADPAAGFGGGQLGAGSQPRVPPKLKTPRI